MENLCLRLDKSAGTTYSSMFDMFHAWQEQAAKLERGEITKEDYDQWRYKYPETGYFRTTEGDCPFTGTERSDHSLSKRRIRIRYIRLIMNAKNLTDFQLHF